MKLVIFIGEQHRIDDLEVPHPVEVHDNGGWRTGLPEYGADWARYFKTDIVMLVEEGPDEKDLADAQKNYYRGVDPSSTQTGVNYDQQG